MVNLNYENKKIINLMKISSIKMKRRVIYKNRLIEGKFKKIRYFLKKNRKVGTIKNIKNIKKLKN